MRRVLPRGLAVALGQEQPQSRAPSNLDAERAQALSAVIVCSPHEFGFDPTATCPTHDMRDEGDCRMCYKAARKRDPEWHPQVSPELALATHWDYDAHIASYTLEGASCPRLNKKSLPALKDEGMEPRMVLMLIDLDGPDHQATPQWRASTLRAIQTLPMPTAWYETQNGMRLCWRTPELTLQEWSTQRSALARLLHAHGIVTDPAANGWNRLMRLPNVKRDNRNITGRSFGTAQLPQLELPAAAPANPFAAIGNASAPIQQIMRSTQSQGSRNNTLTRIAGRLRADGMPLPLIRERLIQHNLTRFSTPLPPEEVDNIVGSAAGWTTHVQAREAANPYEEPYSRTDPLTSGAERELLERIRDDLQATVTGAPLIWAEGSLHRWRQTQWRPLTAATVRNLVGVRYERWPIMQAPDKDGNPRTKPAIISHNKAAAVAKMLQDALEAEDAERQTAQVSWFDDAPLGAPFQNGWLTPDHKLTQHEYTNRNQHIIPADYQPNSRPPLFVDKLLGGCLRDHNDPEGAIQLIREWFGLALLGQCTRFQTALMFSGGGNNGKSTVLNVILALFQGRHCSLTPQSLSDPRLTPLLHGAHLNVITECPSAELMVAEEIKAAISGDTITANPKNLAPFAYRPRAGHVFAANELPPVRDMTEGFFRRFKVIDFNRRFLEHEIDRDLQHAIITTELDQVASWLVDGGLQALERDSLTIPLAVTQATQRWRSSANKVAQFIDEYRQEFTITGTVPAAQLYQRYKMWHADTGGAGKLMGRYTFYRKLTYVDGVSLDRSQDKKTGTTAVFKKLLKAV